eukprot:1721921-Amphidinium_carterae.1
MERHYAYRSIVTIVLDSTNTTSEFGYEVHANPSEGRWEMRRFFEDTIEGDENIERRRWHQLKGRAGPTVQSPR